MLVVAESKRRLKEIEKKEKIIGDVSVTSSRLFHTVILTIFAQLTPEAAKTSHDEGIA
jgi:hypothetical protein